MEEVRSTARLADPAGFDFEARGIATTIARAEVEEALMSDAPPELMLDVARPGEDELHTVLVSWDRADLERLLEQSSEGRVTLTFDQGELANAIDWDVEAHGIREKALVLTVFAAGAVGTAAGVANAQVPGEGWSKGAPVTATSDRSGVLTDTSSSAQAAASERGDFVTDTSSAAPGDVIASDRGVVPVSEVGGQAVAAERGSDFVTDVSSAAPGDVIASDRGVVPVTDPSSGVEATPVDPAIRAALSNQEGTASARGDFVTDVSSAAPGDVIASDRGVVPVTESGPATASTPATADDGGISIPDGAAGAAVAGGVALLIAGAGFAATRQGRRHRPGTA
jgi:hypothetical protein